MNCPYADNPFCQMFNTTERSSLCAHCNTKTYFRGQWLFRRQWGDSLVLCVKGMIVFGEMDEKRNRLVTNEVMGKGFFPSIGCCSGDLNSVIHERSALCVTDCVMAIFDSSFVQDMFNTNIKFVQSLFRIVLRNCCNDGIALVNAIGNGEAYEAVRYVCQFCKTYDIEPLTHAQIAMICNRTRPTVTEIMHRLTINEPDLFQR